MATSTLPVKGGYPVGQGSVDYAWDLSVAAQRIADGLPTSVLGELQTQLKLTNQELADLVFVSPRTLNRRRSEERMPPGESDRAYRLGRLFVRTAQVLGGEAEARDWMKTPNYALGDQAPLDMARTAPGAELVERVLGQITYGLPI